MRLSKEERECFTWYLKNKDNGIASHLFNMAQMVQCPCDSGLLRFDPRFTFSRIDYKYKVMCYATMTIGRNAVRSIDSVIKSFVSFLSIVLSWIKQHRFLSLLIHTGMLLSIYRGPLVLVVVVETSPWILSEIFSCRRNNAGIQPIFSALQ